MRFCVLSCSVVLLSVTKSVFGTHVAKAEPITTEVEPSEVLAIPNLSFAQLLHPQDGYSDRIIGVLENKYVVSVSANPHTILTQSDWKILSVREDCRERLGGFIPHLFSESRVIEILNKLNYSPCGMEEMEVHQPDYVIKAEFTGDEKNRILNCMFTDLPTGRLLAGSRFSPGKWKVPLIGNVLSSKFRNRVKAGNLESQLRECANMLNTIVKIDTQFAEYALDPSEYDLGEILLGEVEKVPLKAQEEKKESMGAGYIVLIVLGALAILGGTYYAYARYSSNKGSTKKTKTTRRQRLESGSATHESEESSTQNFVH